MIASVILMRYSNKQWHDSRILGRSRRGKNQKSNLGRISQLNITMILYSIFSCFLTTMVGVPVLIFYKIEVKGKISAASSKIGSQLGNFQTKNIKSHITTLNSGFQMDLLWLSLANVIHRSCDGIQNKSQR